ncbi:MAG: hypothetical protein KAI26_04195 [Nanoarchaeota archaeon]|nr:hypothetical protein [Nanoarchaeota archaeon]
MSEYWYDEGYECEAEPQIELPKESAELKIELSINAGQIELAIKKQVDDIFEDRIKKMIKHRISESMKQLLDDDYWSKDNLKEILYKAINNRLDSKYPEIVQDKVNEFYEAINKIQYSENRHDNDFSSIKEKAKKKVDFYIENELKDSVSKSKEYIEQFAKNYFANNLFRAMGMMDKMLPQTENIQNNK